MCIRDRQELARRTSVELVHDDAVALLAEIAPLVGKQLRILVHQRAGAGAFVRTLVRSELLRLDLEGGVALEGPRSDDGAEEKAAARRPVRGAEQTPFT